MDRLLPCLTRGRGHGHDRGRLDCIHGQCVVDGNDCGHDYSHRKHDSTAMCDGHVHGQSFGNFYPYGDLLFLITVPQLASTL